MLENAIKLFAAIGIAAGTIAAVLKEYQNLTSGPREYIPDNITGTGD